MAATVVVERRIAAAPEQVFDAWLDPDQAGRWLFRTPDGVLERCEIDARVGGRFRIDERRGDELAEHYGEYVELDRPRRLAFDFWTSFSDERTRVTIAIAPDGDGAPIHPHPRGRLGRLGREDPPGLDDDPRRTRPNPGLTVPWRKPGSSLSGPRRWAPASAGAQGTASSCGRSRGRSERRSRRR